MAGFDQTASRPGQLQGAGDARAIFLKLYGGEVIKAFRQENVATKLISHKSIGKGKSISFPMFGKGVAKYHQVGKQIEADVIQSGEVVITLEDMLIAPRFLSDIDELIQHFDSRIEYSFDAGAALAEQVDSAAWRMLAKSGLAVDAAGAAALGVKVPNTYEFSENVTLAAAGDEADAASLYRAFIKARTNLKKVKVKGKPVIVTTPDVTEVFLSATDVSTAPWMNRDVGGVGNAAQGIVGTISGMPIYETTNLPTEDESAGSPIEPPENGTTKFRGDYSNIIALVFTKEASALATRQGVKVTVDRDFNRMGTLINASMLTGHGALNPACCVVVKKAAA